MDHTVDELKQMVNIVDVISGYGIDLKKRGSEYVSLCPFHSEKTPSFSVNEQKQLYYCFGCGAGSSSLDFIMDYEKLELKDGVNRLKEIAGVTDGDGRSDTKPKPRIIDRAIDPADKWQAVIPVPNDAPKLINNGKTIPIFNPKTDKYNSYQPETGGVYPYRNADGDLIGAVLKVLINGKKITPTVTFCVNTETGEMKWILKGFPEPRPIYNVDTFKDHDEVLIVEGEKCADAAYNASHQVYDIASWPMGTNAIDRVDWSPLFGRRAVLWADNDLKPYKKGPREGEIMPKDEQNGRKAMLWLKDHLESNGCTVTLLDQPDNKPDGWDVADAVDEGYGVAQYVVDHMPHTPSAIEGELVDDEDDDSPVDTSEIVSLGYDNGGFYYYSKFTKQIMSLRDREHGKNQLLGLAPLEWWVSKADDGKGKPQWDELISMLMNRCRAAGIFDSKKVRGRGCWIDDGRFVMHMGDRLLVDNETVNLGEIKSKYVYQAAKRTKAPKNPLSNEQAKKLLDTAKTFDWEVPASAPLLAGFCVLAPVCGVLDWRSHVWINGGSGSGKSTVAREFAKKLIGNTSVNVSLNSSIAGLRNTLKNDAFPVLVNEFDPATKSSYDKAQEYFDMMRDASDDEDTPTLRANSSGGVIEYSSNSMFMLIGIQICTNEQAVLNRTAILSLRSRANKTDEQKRQNVEQWAKIQKSLNENINSVDDIAERLLARTISQIDIILENVKTFRSAANKYFGNARHADQYGTLLAGSYSLVSDCLVHEDTAMSWIKRFDWTAYTEETEEDDSIEALNSILQVRLRVEFEGSPFKTMSVGEAIDEVRLATQDMNGCHDELRRFGILVRNDHFVVSNNSAAIAEAMRGKPWGTKWGKYLSRIPETKKTDNAVSFASGIKQRGVIIPFDLVFGVDNEVFDAF